MLLADLPRVGFVVKRYPRYSETFIVREILAHEHAGLAVEIFTLKPTNDGHFQDLIARVKAPVNYLYFPAEGLLPERLAGATLTAAHFWRALMEASAALPDLWPALEEAREAPARDVYQALQLAREVRRKSIHHLHAPFASEPATIARLAARFAGVTYSFTARAKDIFHESVQADDLRRKLRDAAAVVTISDYHLEYLRATYGPLARHVQRIYNGLDLQEYAYQSPCQRSARIVAVGRLVEKKGFADLLEACKLLAGRGRDFQCRIIGAGALQAELQAQIERLGLEKRVALLGPLPQGEVIKEIQLAAVLAAPCIVGTDGDRDGLPNVIQEALALGTPVISTDVTGIPEVVRDGETGLQVAQRDPEALATAIERLLLDPDLRVDLASRARRFMEEEFDIHGNTARRRAIFQAAAASDPIPRGGERRADSWQYQRPPVPADSSQPVGPSSPDESGHYRQPVPAQEMG
jgi:glycosyltransferase involved in cell wall biosynthesis